MEVKSTLNKGILVKVSRERDARFLMVKRIRSGQPSLFREAVKWK